MLAFQGADGFAKNIDWGRVPTVQIKTVTNLNDSGSGSFRDACSSALPTIVVFDISGTIELASSILIRDNTYVAGHTAPGDGITLRNYRMTLIGRNNIVIRFIRFRLGDTASQVASPIFIRDCTNIIVDHCSFSWGIDETFTAFRNRNVSIQWCIFAEGLNNSIHPDGTHGFGTFIDGKDISIHHCLTAHFDNRYPMFANEDMYSTTDQLTNFRGVVDYRMNSHYNSFGTRYANGGGEGTYNLINNYYKNGPGNPTLSKFLQPQKTTSGTYGQFYIDGNIMEGFPLVNADNREGVRFSGDLDTVIVNTQFSANVYDIVESAEDAHDKILLNAGASLFRDSVDSRIVGNVIDGDYTFEGSNGSTDGLIDSQTDVGGWPVLNTTTPPTKSQPDGIPDSWKTANGLSTAVNYNGVDSGDGRYWIEVYLDELANTTFPIPPETPWTIDFIISGSGSVSVDPDNENYSTSEEVTLTATPTNELWEFVNWTDQEGNVNTDNPRVFTVPANNTIFTALFTLITPLTGKRFRGRKPIT
jgi:hypothetical protein